MSDQKLPEKNDAALDSLWNQAVADANNAMPADTAIPLPAPPASTLEIGPDDPMSVEELVPPPINEVNAVVAKAQQSNDPRLGKPLGMPPPTSAAPSGSVNSPIALPAPSRPSGEEQAIALPPPAKNVAGESAPPNPIGQAKSTLLMPTPQIAAAAPVTSAPSSAAVSPPVVSPPVVSPPVAANAPAEQAQMQAPQTPTTPLAAEPPVTASVTPPQDPPRPDLLNKLPEATDLFNEEKKSTPWLGILLVGALIAGLAFVFLRSGDDGVNKDIESASVATKRPESVARVEQADTKAADTKAADTKAADAKAADAKAADTKAADAKAADTKAADTKAGGALADTLKQSPALLVSRAFNFAGEDAGELSGDFRKAFIAGLRKNGASFSSKDYGAYLKPYLTKLTLGDKDTSVCVLRVSSSKAKGAPYERLSEKGSAPGSDTHIETVKDCATRLADAFNKKYK